MGQHKHNKVAIDAKEGKIQPKSKDPMTKRERERMITELLRMKLYERMFGGAKYERR